MPIWPAFRQSPLEAPPCGENWEILHIALWETLTSALHHPSHISGKLVYAAEWMRKTKHFLGEEEAEKKGFKEEVISERWREEVTWWKRWGQVFAQARLGFWRGLFPVHPGKCGPQLSRLMKATTCSSLKANLCFLAASSCSSAHTICQQDSKVSTDTQHVVIVFLELTLTFMTVTICIQHQHFASHDAYIASVSRLVINTAIYTNKQMYFQGSSIVYL